MSYNIYHIYIKCIYPKKMKPIGQIKLVIVSWQAEMVVGDLKEAFIIV